MPGHRADNLRRFIHTEMPSLAILFHPNQRPCFRAAADRNMASVPAAKKNWGRQKIAHVRYGYNASRRAGRDAE